MAEQKPPCDIIMKGGITSGVVYPKAILRLAEKYSFRSIGGTSAGAIVAVLTAAAEYNRDGGGFKKLGLVADEISGILKKLFQPYPSVRGLFDAWVLAFLDKKCVSAFFTLARAHWRFSLCLLVLWIALAAAILLFPKHDLISILSAFILLLVAALAGAATLVVGILWQANRRLQDMNFGVCPGRTQPYSKDNEPGLSDWIAEKIEIIVGRMQEGGRPPPEPLTFGDLWEGADKKGSEKEKRINLQMMTTNLTARRPNVLPHVDDHYLYRENDFRELFPSWIVDYLRENTSTEKEIGAPEEAERIRAPDGYRFFPSAKKLPLVVAARMSLSLPLLFSAVPLYRFERPFREITDTPGKLLFSDGGLSSNFPVHFFDAMLPQWPTFGVSLEEHDERILQVLAKRGVKPVGNQRSPDGRVYLPIREREGTWLNGRKIESLGSFAMSLVDTAKDWQDRLQSTLAGYSERIVRVFLAQNEGGINLTMDANKILQLVDYGDRAGLLMAGENTNVAGDITPFNFDRHRWRRFLIAFAHLEQALQRAAATWGTVGDPKHFADFVHGAIMDTTLPYGPDAQWRKAVFDRFDEMMKMATAWKDSLRLANEGKNIPQPLGDLRITPKP